MKLYGSPTSPFVRHCRIALTQGGFDWQLVAADGAAAAAASPAQKVPYFEHRDVFLTDSVSILKYVREKSGQPFLPRVEDCELFCLASTLLDASINLFLLEKEGLTVSPGSYLERQANRVISGLKALDKQARTGGELDDAHLRLACYLDWGLFRQRIELSSHASLLALLEHARSIPVFAQTAPPPAA